MHGIGTFLHCGPGPRELALSRLDEVSKWLLAIQHANHHIKQSREWRALQRAVLQEGHGMDKD